MDIRGETIALLGKRSFLDMDLGERNNNSELKCEMKYCVPLLPSVCDDRETIGSLKIHHS